MAHIYVIIDKYIYDVTDFHKYNNYQFDLKNYHLKNATFDIIMKHENDSTFNLFNKALKNKKYLGINLICNDIFKKNIPDYFYYFFSNQEKDNYLQEMENDKFILVYENNKYYNLYIKNNNIIYNLNIIYLSNNWCYYSIKGVYNSVYIEDLIDLIILNKLKIINILN